MLRRLAVVPVLAVAALVAGSAVARAALVKWPPWLSIEAPVNPFDPDTRSAVLLVHAMVREGPTSIGDLVGSAEGLVRGERRSVPLRFEPTSRPGVYAVRRQWPTDGAWLLRITLLRNTTALVTLAPSGDVLATRVPTRMNGGQPLPRAVAMQEIDSVLAVAAR